MGEIKYSSKYS